MSLRKILIKKSDDAEFIEAAKLTSTEIQKNIREQM